MLLPHTAKHRGNLESSSKVLFIFKERIIFSTKDEKIIIFFFVLAGTYSFLIKCYCYR